MKLIEENLITINHCWMPLSICDTKFVVEDYHGQGRGITAYCHLVEDKAVTLARLSSDLTKLLFANRKRIHDNIAASKMLTALMLTTASK